MRAFLLALALVLTAPLARATPMFMGLGTVPGGGGSAAFAVSADGSAVVGLIEGSPQHAFRWTPGTGMVDLGDLVDGSGSSWANSASADGSVVVGFATSSESGEGEPFRWTSGSGMVGLGSLPSGIPPILGQAYDVSADGSVVVGESGNEAFRWTTATGMVSLGGVLAEGVSADGSVVVGFVCCEAFRWTSDTGLVGLGILPGGTGSEAFDVSGDGSVVVGAAYGGPDTTEAFRWTFTDGMVGLGALPGGSLSYALAVSGDGSIVVGAGNDSSGASQPIIWDASHGMRSLRDVLVGDYGFDLTGWTLQEATGISANGLTIVGSGTNPNGQPEAWIAVLPEPSTAVLLALGLAGLAAWRRRLV